MSPEEHKAAEDKILADMAATRMPIKLTDGNDAVLLSFVVETGIAKVRVGGEHRTIHKTQIKGTKYP